MITASIVLYNNNIVELERSIHSVLSNRNLFKLFLVDNSPSDSFKFFSNWDDRIVYIFAGANKGFGAGHNIAIRKILHLSDYHVVVNPDVDFGDDVFRNLELFAIQNPNVANLMPKVVYDNGNIQYLCKLLPTPYDWIGRRFNPFKSLVEKRNKIFELRFTNYDKVMQVPYLSGCFMFLNVKGLKIAGLFDERIFMYGEETDLCRRFISAGYQTIFYPKVTITHSFQKGSHKSWRLTAIGIASAIYYFNKWGWIFDSERKKINKHTLKLLGL